MEFLELIEAAMEFAPPQYSNITDMVLMAAPFLLLIVSAATCFFGLKIHKLWIVFMFFSMGFWLGALVTGLLAPSLSIYISIGIGLALGIGCALAASRLRRVQVFILNSVMAYSFISSLIFRFTDKALICALLALAAAILAGALAVHFMHPITILSTSLLGAQNLAAAIPLLGLAYSNIISGGVFVVLSVMGIAVQFIMLKRSEAHKPVKISHYTRPISE